MEIREYIDFNIDEIRRLYSEVALYVLADYYGKGVAQQLMKAGLQQLANYPQICLWVLKENKRAIRFYEKCGFVPTGEELVSPNIGAAEIRMILKCES